MVKEVEEAHQGRVAVVQEPLARVLGDVERQWSVGAEEAEEALLQSGRPPVVHLEGRQSRRRERDGGLLGKTHGLIPRAQRLSELRAIGEQTFDPAQGLEEVERPGRTRERVE